jgi:RNA polymerase sigma-70 factor (ECF subfamily)
VARNGLEVGSEAAADAMAWAVAHSDRMAAMDNPAGYLYRVGQTAARRHRRWARRHVVLAVEPLASPDEPFDAELFDALSLLRADHRVAVVLVHCFGYRYREVAELLGVSEAAVTNHVHRGLARLRSMLGGH